MDTGDVNEENIPSKTKAMNIFEILEVVIKNVESTQDLMRCRYVNSTWRELSTKVLMKRKSLTSTFRFCDDSMTFELVKGQDRARTHKKLDDLNECLESCTYLFPCVDFTFTGGNLGKIEIQDFLKYQGIYIKNLQLELYCESSNKHCTTLNTLQKLLIEYPIESLCIPSFPEQWQNKSESKLFSSTVVLPALRHLKLGLFYSNYDRIIGELLVAAKNLVSFENIYHMDGHFHVSYIPTFVEANKIETIVNFDFRPRDDTMLDFYTDFANAGPKLKYLTVYSRFLLSQPELYQRASMALNKILESSKDTLEVIHTDPIGRFPGLQVPVMSNLREIKVNLFSSVGFAQFDPAVFPQDFAFAEKFPRLCNLKLEYRRPEPKSTWSSFFPFPIRAPSVKTLTIKRHGPNFVSLKLLSEFFPSLEKFSMGEQDNFPSIALDLWTHLNKLTSLDLTINVESPANRFPHLDTALIGFSTGQECSVVPQISKNNASILNMKNLRDLEIKFHSGTFDPRESYELLSQNADIHGLGLLRDVRIRVCAFAKLKENRQNLLNALEPVAKYMEHGQQ